MEAARAAASSAVAAVSQHASDASKAVQNVVGTATLTAACKMAEIEIKKRSGKAIEIVCAENIPAEWVSWIRTTGINSLCANDTWSFLEDSSYNARKVTMWHERDMTKIIIDVARDPEEFTESWKICEVVYEPGAHEFTLLWYPRAKTLESPATWVERGGDRRYWNLSTHIPFGLGIQQLPGPTFYKSDWVDNFEDADPDSYFDKGTTTFRRWLQFRHWTLVWYARAVPNWNHQWCTIPPRMEDGREFEFHSVVELPTMPGFEVPTNIQTPTLEDVKMPNGQTQQLNPNEPPATEGNNDGAATGEEDKNNKKLPKRKHRPTNPYAAHGFIELVGLHAVAKGNKLILTEATVVNFWEVEGKIEVERREKQRMELKCSSKEQADSWAQSLCRAGAVNDEVTACCVVA